MGVSSGNKTARTLLFVFLVVARGAAGCGLLRGVNCLLGSLKSSGGLIGVNMMLLFGVITYSLVLDNVDRNGVTFGAGEGT